MSLRTYGKFSSLSSHAFACALLLFSFPCLAAGHQVEVMASGLNVRTEGGAIRCSIRHGTKVEVLGKHKDGQRYQVKVPGCGSGGESLYVYSNFVKPVDNGAYAATATVDADGLSFRSAPRAGRDTWKCSLGKRGTKLRILGDEARSGDLTWIKVAPVPAKAGCPAAGYVAKFYLKPVEAFPDLPVVGSQETECPACDKLARENHNYALEGLQKLSDGIGRTLSSEPKEHEGLGLGSLASRFAQAAEQAAGACRAIAPHVCAVRGRKYPCGKGCGSAHSKGWCKQAVREAAEKTLGFTLPGGSALAAKPTLEHRMEKLAGVTSCNDPRVPVGAICLYRASQHNWGHIEVRTGKYSFCSDFCSAHPIRSRKGAHYTLVGVYYP